MKTIVYEAYVVGTNVKATFELPENATIWEKRFEADSAIRRKLDIRFRKKKIKTDECGISLNGQAEKQITNAGEYNMENEATVVSIEFTGSEMDLILKYMDAVEAVTVQAAILNAVSLALDHVDD